MMKRHHGNYERPTWKWTLKRCAPPALTAVALWSGLPGLSAAQSGWKWFGKQGPVAQAPATPKNGFATSVQRLMEQARQEAAAGQMTQAVATAQRAHKIADAAAAVLGNDPQCSPAVTQKFLADMQVLAQSHGTKSTAVNVATAPPVSVPAVASPIRQPIAAVRPVTPPRQPPAVTPATKEREEWLAVIRSGETATPRAAAAPPAVVAAPPPKQTAPGPLAMTHTAPAARAAAPLPATPAVPQISLRPQFEVEGGEQTAVAVAPSAPQPVPVAAVNTAPVVPTTIMSGFGLEIEGGNTSASPQLAESGSELPAWGSDLLIAFNPSKTATSGLPIPVMTRWSSANRAIDSGWGFSTEIVSYDADAVELTTPLTATTTEASPVVEEVHSRTAPVSTESARVTIPAVGEISFAPSIALLDEPATERQTVMPAPESTLSTPSTPVVDEPVSRKDASAPSLPVRIRQYPVANALAVRESAVETAVEIVPEMPIPASSTTQSASQPLPLSSSTEANQPPQTLRMPDPVPTEWSSAVPGTSRQPRAARTAEDEIWQPSKSATPSSGKASKSSAAAPSKSATRAPSGEPTTGTDQPRLSDGVVAIKHETPRSGTLESAVVLPAAVTSRYEAPAVVTGTVSLEAGVTVDVATIPQGPSAWTRQASLDRSASEAAASGPGTTSYLERLARRWKLSPSMLVSLAGGAALFLLGCSTYLFARRQNPA